MTSSSSDSEDEEEKRRLAQAVDPDFLGSSGPKSSEKSGTNGITNGSATTGEGAPKSKRSKMFDVRDECSEFAKPYSLDVTPEGQKFIAKQLAKSLDRSLKEVSPSIPSASNGTDSGIKLFATSQNPVTEEDLKPRRPHRRKPVKKKKKKTSNASDSSSDSESEKLKSVAVTADWVIQST